MIGRLSAVVAMIACAIVLSSCAEEGEVIEEKQDVAVSGTEGVSAKAPEDAYYQLVSAVKERKYELMYDLMDSTYQAYTDRWFEENLAQLQHLDSAERAGWEQFRSIRDQRKRFKRLVEVSPMMRERFVGGYKVLDVDTVVSVVTQHQGQRPQITYFRLENGEYKYTAPPESKIAPPMVKRAP